MTEERRALRLSVEDPEGDQLEQASKTYLATTYGLVALGVQPTQVVDGACMALVTWAVTEVENLDTFKELMTERLEYWFETIQAYKDEAEKPKKKRSKKR